MRFNAEPLPRRRRGGKGWETLTLVLHEARLVGQAIALRGLSRFAVLATSRQTTKSDRLSHRARRGINELRVGFRREDPEQGAPTGVGFTVGGGDGERGEDFRAALGWTGRRPIPTLRDGAGRSCATGEWPRAQPGHRAAARPALPHRGAPGWRHYRGD